MDSDDIINDIYFSLLINNKKNQNEYMSVYSKYKKRQEVQSQLSLYLTFDPLNTRPWWRQ